DARYSSLPLRVAALRCRFRDIVDGELLILIAVWRMLYPCARMTAMTSPAEKDRYLPDTGASSIGGIPPACRNHRDPTGADTPHATAASSPVSPASICTQNARSRSRRTGGRPGDRITARPVHAAAQPGGRPIESTSISEVLRPPVEPALYLTRTKLDLPHTSGAHIITWHAPPNSTSAHALEKLRNMIERH